MTGTWLDGTSITPLIRFTARSEVLSIAAHLVFARKMGGKVGLICGSCWSGKYSTYNTIYALSLHIFSRSNHSLNDLIREYIYYVTTAGRSHLFLNYAVFIS